MKRLVLYARDSFCPDQAALRRWLEAWQVAYDEVNISRDPAAAQRLEAWNGHLGVPTLIVAQAGRVEPFTPPAPLTPGQSSRDLDRGSLICEPSQAGLRRFLERHGLLPAAPSTGA